MSAGIIPDKCIHICNVRRVSPACCFSTTHLCNSFRKMTYWSVTCKRHYDIQPAQSEHVCHCNQPKQEEVVFSDESRSVLQTCLIWKVSRDDLIVNWCYTNKDLLIDGFPPDVCSSYQQNFILLDRQPKLSAYSFSRVFLLCSFHRAKVRISRLNWDTNSCFFLLWTLARPLSVDMSLKLCLRQRRQQKYHQETLKRGEVEKLPQ